MQAKQPLDEKIRDNNSWFEMKNSEYEKQKRIAAGGNPYAYDNPSAWLFSSIANKHADFMDNIPMPAVQAREQSDETSAKILAEVLPVIFEQNDFEEKYDNACWDKLKSSASVYSVVWDKHKNGIGDICIDTVDILNLFWQPDVKNIQDSKNLFYVKMVDLETAKEMFPDFDISATPESLRPKQYREQQLDNSQHENERVAIVNWYYKKYSVEQNRYILHYVQYINEHLIFASENDPELKFTGWYDHGYYPFIVDNLFYSANSPVGISLVDINKQNEKDIEELKRYIMENAKETRGARYFIKDSDVDFNMDDFSNPDKKFIRVSGGVGDDRIRPIQVQALPNFIYEYMNFLITEQKETSNNKDISTGSTGSGVTSGAAIAALQEAGNKTSRDMLKGTYRVYAEACRLVIELIRQFYTEERCFRVVLADGGIEYKMISSQMLKPTTAAGIIREPIFDVKVSAQKSSPFSRVAQNEMAQNLYNIGAFNPDNIDATLVMLSIMDFDGKDQVIEKLNTQKSLQQQVSIFNSVIQNLMSNPATAQIAQQAVQQAQFMMQMQGATGTNGTQSTQGMVQQNLANNDSYQSAISGAMNEYKTPYANKLAQKTIVDTSRDNNDNSFIK